MFTQASVGIDMDGDACIYIARYDDNGDFVGYLTEKELEEVAEQLNHNEKPDPPLMQLEPRRGKLRNPKR